MARGTDRQLAAAVVATVATAALLLAGCSKASDGGAASPPAATSTSTAAVRPDDSLKLNQIQVVGTHNSYHQAATGKEHQLLVDLNPEQAAQRTYTHPPLPTQLGEQKARQLEIDVYADSRGGLYATPSLRRQAGLPPYLDQFPEMAEPGTKVLHEQDVDYHSVCPVFVGCLKQIKAWSDAHPDHVPLAIDVDFKDGPLIFAVPDQAKPEKWTSEAMDGLDAEIRSVFPARDIITPEQVRHGHQTLEEGVLDGGWPTLGDSRGKVIFLMANGQPYPSIYAAGHPNLDGRIMFIGVAPGQPDASYIDVDDPVAGAKEITDLVRKGYLVRTRADANEVEAKAGDSSRLEAALRSGAQWISTDYPGPDGAKGALGTHYIGELPGFLSARCNPITAPKGCRDVAVEP
ncbi:MAG TPA: phosphatidylinositol-specific phospholipase C1-like protein [Acidimicrobiales bacterium]